MRRAGGVPSAPGSSPLSGLSGVRDGWRSGPDRATNQYGARGRRDPSMCGKDMTLYFDLFKIMPE